MLVSVVCNQSLCDFASAAFASAAGRDPGQIEISTFGRDSSPEMVQKYEDAGAARYVLFVDSFGPEEMERELTALAKQLGL